MTTEPIDLGEFEGRKVTKTTIRVVKAGDGLSTAVKTEPRLLHQGERGCVVLEYEVGPIKFDPYDDGVCARVQDLLTLTATFIDADVVRDAIDQQREKNEVAAEIEKGTRRLPTPEALHGEHIVGDHDTVLTEGCPDCDEERATIAQEVEAEEARLAGSKPKQDLDDAPRLSKAQLSALAVLVAGPSRPGTKTDATGEERTISKTHLSKLREFGYAIVDEADGLARVTDDGRVRFGVENEQPGAGLTVVK